MHKHADGHGMSHQATYLLNFARRQKIIYVGHTMSENKRLLDDLATADGCTDVRRRGKMRIEFSDGGSVTFTTPRSINGVRGLSCDHVFTDDHAILNDKRIRETLTPCFLPLGDERYSVFD